MRPAGALLALALLGMTAPSSAAELAPTPFDAPRHSPPSLPSLDRSAALCALRGGSVMSSWRTWAYKTLAKMGIFLKKGKLLVLGLDNAGKSTLLTVLMRNEVVPTAPTHQPVTDEIKVGHMKLQAVDMGGHEIARRMWLQYSHETDGVVFIVDACDRDRFLEAALELHKLLAASALPASTPVLILGNKGDLPHSATQEELYWGLGLDELFKKGDRPLGLFMCSVFERRGYSKCSNFPASAEHATFIDDCSFATLQWKGLIGSASISSKPSLHFDGQPRPQQPPGVVPINVRIVPR